MDNEQKSFEDDPGVRKGKAKRCGGPREVTKPKKRKTRS
jgi:hypothetical protein